MMFMFKFVRLLPAALVFMVSYAQAYDARDMEKLKNDKEVVSVFINKSEKARLLKKYSDPNFQSNLQNIFSSTLLNFVNDSSQCELDFISRFHSALVNAQIGSDKELRKEYIKLLRATNSIDDILLEILLGSNEDQSQLAGIEKKYNNSDDKKIITLFKHKDLLEKNDVKDIFINFTNFPDDKSACTYQEFNTLKNKITKLKDKSKKDHFEFLTKKAYQLKVISYATYLKLNYLDKNGSSKRRDNSLNGYLQIIFKAKNSMIPKNAPALPSRLDNLDQFSTEKVRRFSNLTRRRVLYRKYSETQIILLAQILQKSSRRMGVDPDVVANTPYINQEFTRINENGETETYVERTEIDPQSQYNLARRLMRKDILNLQTMDIFQQTKITYEDIVMASLETGYISLDDVAFIVQYDDLWNPHKTPYDKVSGFIFKFAGYATFFLPPPWNVFTSLAIGIVGGVIDKHRKSGAENDNPATFIE